MPSELGSVPEDVNRLRDPGIFEDSDGSLYLIYSGRGEDAVGIARLASADILIGDMNGDGGINSLDITPFITALSDPEAYQTVFNLDEEVSGDANGNGIFHFLDIAGFIVLLTG